MIYITVIRYYQQGGSTLSQTPIPEDLSIEHVKQQLAQWRASRAGRQEPIPQSLWQAASALCLKHPITHVCRQLRLCVTDLKKHLPQKAPVAFLELNPGSPGGQWQLLCERADGARLHLCATGHPPAPEALLRQFLS